MRWPRITRATLTVACCALVVSGCGGTPLAPPTIGSPSPTPTRTAITFDRSAQLAREWELSGVPLPADWPDVPLPRGAEVVTAYAIGAEPRRTWTATFTAEGGTALDLAEPVVAALRKREYVPIAEYVGAAETNTGLYSFAAPTFAVYVVLGEDDGQPNVVLTVRGSTHGTGLLGGGDLAAPSPTVGSLTPGSAAAPSPSSVASTTEPASTTTPTP